MVDGTGDLKREFHYYLEHQDELEYRNIGARL